ncbi:hypothetical protein DV515_00010233, partial [Chloebia gouldiae]
ALARHLRPGTLRAVFGTDKIQNAVHCTDLPEDGLLEVIVLLAEAEQQLGCNSAAPWVNYSKEDKKAQGNSFYSKSSKGML